MHVIFIERVAASDLVDYWSEVDVQSPDSEFVLDNPDTVGGCQDAWLVLQRKLAESDKAQLVVELETAGAKELFDEAENRLDIARDAVKSLHPTAERNQVKAAKKLVMAYARLVVQRHRLGI